MFRAGKGLKVWKVKLLHCKIGGNVRTKTQILNTQFRESDLETSLKT